MNMKHPVSGDSKNSKHIGKRRSARTIGQRAPAASARKTTHTEASPAGRDTVMEDVEIERIQARAEMENVALRSEEGEDTISEEEEREWPIDVAQPEYASGE